LYFIGHVYRAGFYSDALGLGEIASIGGASDVMLTCTSQTKYIDKQLICRGQSLQFPDM